MRSPEIGGGAVLVGIGGGEVLVGIGDGEVLVGMNTGVVFCAAMEQPERRTEISAERSIRFI
jgi:hypothetical protein